jgi:CHAT domain/SIR2-like domain
MEQIEYRNFDLLIERQGDGYQAKVLNSPGGAETESFEMPFSDEELETLLNCLGQPGQSAKMFEKAAQDFGGRLFDTVFKGKINTLMHVSRTLVEREDPEKGLRILLRLGDVPELAALPWEYLYNRALGGFFSYSSYTPIVRYTELPKPIQPLRIKPPLRVLVMISNPSDMAPLAGDEELAKLYESFDEMRRQGLVEIERLEKATVSALRLHLLQHHNAYHIFHFIGHGGYDPDSQDGFVFLEDEQGKNFYINGAGLAYHLQDHHSLRLALLNACDGARASLTDPLRGTAQSLLQARIPAVIAMQFPISDQTAIDFASEFYVAMANYWPVDAALAYARQAMNGSEWGTPALYMQSDDGRLFTGEKPPNRNASSEARRVEPPVSSPDDMSYRGMIRAMDAGDLVLFIGAGANLCGRLYGDWQNGPYAPSDGELAECLSDVRRLPDPPRDLVRASQYIALEDNKLLCSELHKVLTRRFRATSLHEFLAGLPRTLREKGCTQSHQLIVTTNYDDVLEKAFDKEDEPYDLVYYSASEGGDGKFIHKPYQEKPQIIFEGNVYDAVPLGKRTVIVKLYGAVNRHDAQQDSYIITEDNYIKHLMREDFINLLPGNIVEKLRDQNSQFLFLGYRLRDWNLRIIFRHIWEEEGPIANSWALGLEADLVDSEFWEKHNVKPLHNSNLQQYVEEMARRLKS